MAASNKDEAPINYPLSRGASGYGEKLEDSIYKENKDIEEPKFFTGSQSAENERKDEEEKDGDYVIKLRNIHKTYLIGIEGVPALRGVSLNVKKGEFVIILGTSGGGKTSLLNIIGTIDNPSRVKYNPLYYYRGILRYLKKL